MTAKKKAKGESAAGWFYGQPGFHAQDDDEAFGERMSRRPASKPKVTEEPCPVCWGDSKAEQGGCPSHKPKAAARDKRMVPWAEEDVTILANAIPLPLDLRDRLMAAMEALREDIAILDVMAQERLSDESPYGRIEYDVLITARNLMLLARTAPQPAKGESEEERCTAGTAGPFGQLPPAPQTIPLPLDLRERLVVAIEKGIAEISADNLYDEPRKARRALRSALDELKKLGGERG